MWRRLIAALTPSDATIQDGLGRSRDAPPDCVLEAIVPDCVLEAIAREGLGLRDALSLCCTCRTVHDATATVCRTRLVAHDENVLRHFPAHVIGSVPMSVWLDVEWVEFDPKWMGSTGYADRVHHGDLRGGPFKCSRDTHGRLMLLMRRETDVAVLFQRYIDLNATWALASSTLPIGGCRLSESMVARMALWLAHDYADFPRSP